MNDISVMMYARSSLQFVRPSECIIGSLVPAYIFKTYDGPFTHIETYFCIKRDLYISMYIKSIRFSAKMSGEYKIILLFPPNICLSVIQRSFFGLRYQIVQFIYYFWLYFKYYYIWTNFNFHLQFS